jgi:hypothetical protein
MPEAGCQSLVKGCLSAIREPQTSPQTEVAICDKLAKVLARSLYRPVSFFMQTFLIPQPTAKVVVHVLGHDLPIDTLPRKVELLGLLR